MTDFDPHATRRADGVATTQWDEITSGFGDGCRAVRRPPHDDQTTAFHNLMHATLVREATAYGLSITVEITSSHYVVRWTPKNERRPAGVGFAHR